MKKTVILAMALWLILAGVALAAPPRGVVTSDNAANYVIVRDGQMLPCQKGDFLYDGDVVKGDGVSGLGVEWHPYAKPQFVSGSELRVGYEPPGIIDVAASKLKEFFGFVDSEVTVQYGATRGNNDKAPLEAVYPLPGFNATVLKGENISFEWGSARGASLVIKDSKNAVVQTFPVRGQKTLEVAADALGLKKGETYTWQVEGMYDQYKLRVLDDVLAAKINDGLRTITETYAGENERLLNKALYCQLVSDANPEKVDLYWLSYRFLSGIQLGSDALFKARVERLRRNVAEHLDSTR